MEEHSIGGNAVPLGEDEEIAVHDVTSGDALARSLPDDPGTGTGEIPQGLDGSFGLPALVERDPDDQHDGGEENERFPDISNDKVDASANDKEEDHRLSQDRYDGPEQIAALGGGNLVGPVGATPPSGLGVGQSFENRGFALDRGGRGSIHDEGPSGFKINASALPCTHEHDDSVTRASAARAPGCRRRRSTPCALTGIMRHGSCSYPRRQVLPSFGLRAVRSAMVPGFRAFRHAQER